MFKLSIRRWNTSIAALLIVAIFVTLLPVRASAQPDNEEQTEQTASESAKSDSDGSAAEEQPSGEQPKDETTAERAPAADTDGQFEQAVALVATASPTLEPLQPYTNQPLIHVVARRSRELELRSTRTDKTECENRGRSSYS